MCDITAYRPWLDALLATIMTTQFSSSPSPSTVSLTVHVFGNAPEHWIRYIDSNDGVQAHRVPTNAADTGLDTSPDGAVQHLLSRLADIKTNEDASLCPIGTNNIHRVPVLLPRGAKPTMIDATAAQSLGIAAVVNCLVERCVTSCGKQRLRLWFSFPSLTDEERKTRLDTIGDLVSHRHILTSTQEKLRRIGLTHARAVEMMWKNQTLPKPDRAAHFFKFAKTLTSLEDLHNCAACLSDNSALAVTRALFLIDAVLDREQVPDGMCVRYGVCPRLDELKAVHFGMETMMIRIMAHERDRIPKELLRGSSELFTWHVVHVPSVGLFVHVPQGLMPPYLEEFLSDWELAFEPGCLQRDLPGGLYVTDACSELNNRYGNTMLEILDRESAICNQLTDKLLQMHDHLSSAFDVVADLDCLCALAQLATEQCMCRPEFTTLPSDGLSIQCGWHPLLHASVTSSTTVSDFSRTNHLDSGINTEAPTPNDAEIQGGGKAVLIVGGPGAGKSVYVAQIGIICFLARIGSFVPAKKATIPEIDRIFSLSSCRESIRDSSFSAGIRVVSEMLRWGSAKSLFLLESFGSATVSCDGVALAAAVLSELAGTKGMVIFATHMGTCLLDALRGLRGDGANGANGANEGNCGEDCFRVMHLSTTKHSGTRVPLYVVRDGDGHEEEEGEGGGEFSDVGDELFAKRVQRVRAAMECNQPTSLDRDSRFSIGRALQDISDRRKLSVARSRA